MFAGKYKYASMSGLLKNFQKTCEKKSIAKWRKRKEKKKNKNKEAESQLEIEQKQNLNQQVKAWRLKV